MAEPDLQPASKEALIQQIESFKEIAKNGEDENDVLNAKAALNIIAKPGYSKDPGLFNSIALQHGRIVDVQKADFTKGRLLCLVSRTEAF